MTYKLILSMSCAVALTACGGGGSSDGNGLSGSGSSANTGANATQLDRTAVSRFNAGEQVRARLQNARVVIPDIIPQTGSSTYTGTATISFNDGSQDVTAQGNASVTARFNNDTITGAANSFILSQTSGGANPTFTNSRNIGGALTLRNGAIAREEAQAATANLNGSLDNGRIVVDVDLAGNFFGDNPGSTPDGLLLTPQTTGNTVAADTITVGGTSRVANYRISVDNN